MKQRNRPSVRLSSALQTVVARAGDSGAAIRALLILGAIASGDDPAALEEEIDLLKSNRAVATSVRHALAAVSDMRLTSVRQVPEVVYIEPKRESLSTEPDLWAIGMEV